MSNNNQTTTAILIVTIVIAVLIAVGFSTHWFGFHHDDMMTEETAKQMNDHLK